MEDLIRTEDLRFSYGTGEGELAVEVLHGVNVTVEKGTFVAVLGRNGSGKSTLARHMNAILLPTGGKVYVAGMDTADEDVLLEIRRRVGMVLQNPDNQIVANVVEEDVAFAPENLGCTPEEIRRRVDKALATVGMTEFSQHAPHLLSGGQKQRIAIAGVLAMAPECVIFDEATAMLDPKGRQDVVELIKKLRRERNTTVVLITHYVNEAIDADRVIIMDGGRIAVDAPPKEAFRDVERLHRLGLSAPETVEFMNDLNARGFDLPLDAMSIESCTEAILGSMGIISAGGDAPK